MRTTLVEIYTYFWHIFIDVIKFAHADHLILIVRNVLGGALIYIEAIADYRLWTRLRCLVLSVIVVDAAVHVSLIVA